MNLNIVSAEQAAQQKYELIIIGSGFGASFFLLEALKKINGNILVLEWGDYHSWNWQLSQGKNSAVDPADTFKNTAEKEWNCTIGFGGGMNCWFAQTPRFHPADFKTASLYGVGNDWPISYDDLEPYYCDVESIMSVSGDPDMQSMFPRSKPYPQPPHRPTAIDRIMKNAIWTATLSCQRPEQGCQLIHGRPAALMPNVIYVPFRPNLLCIMVFSRCIRTQECIPV
ncbi:hypothetical protein AB4160_09805 [Shewanella sp. 10N.286.51.B8]|uniref:hypothetical protein n=1 Tax=Shewanella sp. 10N.286.51.B8 TaxID=3229708 RepID=UPI003552E006